MKLTMCESNLEKAVVCQEIGIAHMILGDSEDANMFGCEAVFFAELSGSTTALLGSLLMHGRAKMRLGEFYEAKDKLVSTRARWSRTCARCEVSLSLALSVCLYVSLSL